MKTQLNLDATGVLAIAAVAAGGLAWWQWPTIKDKLFGDTGALNPANPDNPVNVAVQTAGQTITGDPNWNLGGALYSATHLDPMQVMNTPTLPGMPAAGGYGNGPIYDENGQLVGINY